MMMIFFEFATVAQHGNRGWNRTCVPIDNNPFITHPGHKRLYHKTRVYAPYSLRTECWFFYVPQESEQRKSCETGPTVWRPYPRRLECLTICRCHTTKAAHRVLHVQRFCFAYITPIALIFVLLVFPSSSSWLLKPSSSVTAQKNYCDATILSKKLTLWWKTSDENDVCRYPYKTEVHRW